MTEQQRIKECLQNIGEDWKAELITAEKADWLQCMLYDYAAGNISLIELDDCFTVPF